MVIRHNIVFYIAALSDFILYPVTHRHLVLPETAEKNVRA